MTAYTALVAFHVIVAVLGIGQVAAIAAVASAAGETKEALTPLRPVVKSVPWSLLVMIVTGGALDGMNHGAFHKSLWFLASVVLVFVCGGVAAMASKPLRLLGEGEMTAADAKKRIGMAGRILALVVATITVLMVLKPG